MNTLNLTTLLILLSATVAACGSGFDSSEITPELVAASSPAPAAAAVSPITCGVLVTGAQTTVRLFQLVPANSPNPDPAHCDDWKNGMWYCQATCLPTTYTAQTTPPALACPVCAP